MANINADKYFLCVGCNFFSDLSSDNQSGNVWSLTPPCILSFGYAANTMQNTMGRKLPQYGFTLVHFK